MTNLLVHRFSSSGARLRSSSHFPAGFCCLFVFSVVTCFSTGSRAVYAQSGNIQFQHPQIQLRLQPKRTAGKDSMELEAKVPTASRAEAFTLKDPNRLVIDLFGIKNGPNTSVYAAADSPVPGVRFGSHPDKLRLVLDLRFPNAAGYTWALRNGKLRLSLTVPGGFTAEEAQALFGAGSLSIPPQEVTEAAKPIATPLPPPPIPVSTATPMPTVDAKVLAPTLRQGQKEGQIVQQFPPAPEINTALASQKEISPPKSQERLQLSSIDFQRSESGDAGALRLGISGYSKFTLIRQNSKSYLLTIFDCGVRDQRLELPYFPPDDFKGLEMVHALANRGELHVQINVDEGATLSAQADSKGILIRPRVD